MASRVDIPTAIAGNVEVTLDLRGDDLRRTIDRLKAAAEELRIRRAAAGGAQLPVPPAAAMASLSISSRPQAPPQPAAPVPAQRPAPVPAAAPAAFAAASPVPSEEGPVEGWQQCWATDPLDHDRLAVTAIAYAHALPGLPGGEGHAGWAISASRGLLQLWECSRSGGRGEPALLMMHSQATDHTPAALAVELETRVLLGAAADDAGAEWAVFHSMDAETLLAQRGRAPMPHRPESRLQGRNCLAVASLHAFGGPLTMHAAAAYGGGVAIWKTGTAASPASPAAPRAVWKAHDSLITAMHPAPFALTLYTGAADGAVHAWNMRAKPTAPTVALKHGKGPVAGVFQVNDAEVVTAGADGRLAVWDLRAAARPAREAAVPRGGHRHGSGGAVQFAVSPLGDAAAVATPAGLYCVDLMDPGCHVTLVAAGGLPAPVTSLRWNAATGEILAGGADGAVRVWRRAFPY